MTTEEAILQLTSLKEYLDRNIPLSTADESIDMAIQALRAQQTGGWISVKDRLPPSRSPVLVRFSGNRNFYPRNLISFRIPNSEEIMYENEFGKATHWQPLPEPPKKAYMK